MELIRKLTPKRIFKGKLQYLGIFLCSFCLQEVIRQLIHGINQKSCGCQKGKLISEANIGREVWNKGKAGIYSDETLSLMANKAKTRENKLKGLHRTEEAKQNMSKAQKERFKNKENHPMFGKKQTEKSKKKNTPENLITLGTSCHMKTNSKKMKNYWTEFYQNIMINRIVESLL